MKCLLAALIALAFPFSINAKAAEKSTNVLVHGAFENARVSDHVTAKLRAEGYKAVAVDLPGRTRCTGQGRTVRFRMHYPDALYLATKSRTEFKKQEIGNFRSDAKAGLTSEHITHRIEAAA